MIFEMVVICHLEFLMILNFNIKFQFIVWFSEAILITLPELSTKKYWITDEDIRHIILCCFQITAI